MFLISYGFNIGLFLAIAFSFSATLSAQTSFIEGNVAGTNGQPLGDTEIRFEQRGGQISPIVSRTDVNGHCTAALPRDVYKMSLTERGTVRASITMGAT